MSKSTQPFPKVVLFDLDGTILDNSAVVVKAYATGMQHLGHQVPSNEAIASLAGKNTFDTARAMGLQGDELLQMDTWFWQYFEHYCQTTEEHPVTISGVEKLLKMLQKDDVPMGVVTSNSAKNAKILLQKAQLDHFFETIIGKEDTIKHKPNPDPIYKALNNLAVMPSSSIWMVGDTASDIQAAKKAGITSVGIPQKHSWQSVQKAQPDILRGSMTELYKLLDMKR